MNKRIIIVAICLLALLFTQVTISAADSVIIEDPSISTIIDGKKFIYKNAPISSNGAIFLPFKELLMNLGVKEDGTNIVWDNLQKTITVHIDNQTVVLKAGSKNAYVNDSHIALDEAPINYKSITYIPTSFISKCLNKGVYWLASKSIFVIASAEQRYKNDKDILSAEIDTLDDNDIDLTLSYSQKIDSWTILKNRPSGNEGMRVFIDGINGDIGVGSTDNEKAVSIGDKIYMIDNDGGVREYDPVLDVWNVNGIIPTLKYTYGFFKLVTLNNKIYIVGANFSDIMEYDPATSEYSIKTKLPQPKVVSSAIAAEGKIYLLSGSNKLVVDTLNTLDVYDPVSDKWSKKADMHSGTSDLPVTYLNGKLYVLGIAWMPDMSVYFDAIEKAATIEEKSAIRMAFREALITDHGQNIEIYDIKKDKWSRLMPSSIYWDGNCIEAVNGKLYVFGDGPKEYGNGEISRDETEYSVKEYNPITDTWTKVANMRQKNYCVASTAFNGEIYIIDGASVEKFTPPNK